METSEPLPPPTLREDGFTDYVTIRAISRFQTEVNLTIQQLDNLQKIMNVGLVDSGAMKSFVNRKFIRMFELPTTSLNQPILIRNTDDSLNVHGEASEYLRIHLTVEGHQEIMTFLVSDLGNTNFFLGHNWLALHNPSIDWRTGKISFNRCPRSCGRNRFH